MSRKFLTNIDLNTNLLLNATLSTHSSGTLAGALAYSGGRIVIGNGSAAVNVALSTDSVTVGSTAITIGSSATTIAGLSSVTSTTFVGALTGNASTATALQTAKTINGTSFDGSANITITAAAGTLSGATLASGVTASSLTSVGTLTGLTMGGNIAMGNNKITGLGTPTADGDAATKAYVDNVSAGVNIHDAVVAATTGTIAGTYAAGSTTANPPGDGGTGVGATITYSATGFTTLDTSVTLIQGDRVLVKNGTTALSGTSSIANGIYVVTTAGEPGIATVLTRSTDADNSHFGDLAAGDLVYVIGGSTFGGDQFVQTTKGTATQGTGSGTIYSVKIGTDGISYTQFSGAGAVPYATDTVAGIASFPTAQFSVSTGAVTINNLSGGVITTGTVADGRIASALTGKTYNALTLTAASTGFTIAGGTTSKTLTVSNTLTFTGTDSSSVAFGAGGTVLYSGGALGTPSSATLTNATGLPVATGISGLGTGVATFLATPSSANLRAALTDESGTGGLIFAGGDIGAATATTATAGTNTTQVATTAFVTAAVSAGAGSGLKKYTATNASLTPSSGEVTWTVSAATHGLGAIGSIIPSLKEVSSGSTVEPDFLINDSTGDVTVKWNAAATVSSGAYRLTLIG